MCIEFIISIENYRFIENGLNIIRYSKKESAAEKMLFFTAAPESGRYKLLRRFLVYLPLKITHLFFKFHDLLSLCIGIPDRLLILEHQVVKFFP